MKPFILFCVSILSIKISYAQPVALLDAYYNNETKKDASGTAFHWHYAWDDFSDGGFGLLAKVFTNQGVVLKTIYTAPARDDLKAASIYIIVDPDHLKDNPNPHYMNKSDANIISKWVKKGGVLVLMANDSLNCDLQHFNILANKFGIAFTHESVNMVKGMNYEMGAVFPIRGNHIFSSDLKIFMKDVSALSIDSLVEAVAGNGERCIIAHAVHGKGHVVAIGDPWLYNEYIDNRKLPDSFQNTKAAEELITSLLKFSKIK